MISWANERCKLSELIPWDGNPRQINEVEGRRLAESLEEFGQIQTIAIGPDDEILDGHQRRLVWSASEKFGPDYEIDVRVASRALTEKERQKLVVYLHRGTMGDWDWDALADGFEIEDLLKWGFDEAELGLAGFDLSGDEAEDPGAQIDKAVELQEKWQVQRGQIWQAGEHFIACGDCRELKTWTRLLAAAKVDKVNGVFTSPPYAEQRKKQYGGVPTNEYVDWWEAVQANVRAHLADDGSFFVNIKPHAKDKQRSLHVFDLVIAMRRDWQWLFVDEFCWRRTGIPQQVVNRFKNQFEPVYWFASTGDFKFRPEAVQHFSNSVPLALGPGAGDTNAARRQGKGGGAIQGNKIVSGMAYPGNLLDFKQNAQALDHAAAFPTALPDFFIRAYSDEDDVWLDPFLGSGTTICAAHQNDRRGLGIELLEKYVSVTLERMADMGLQPELMES